ncbi:uncharacterized protein A4U43_C09F5930 [Asparagus officinalis]|uniref:O-methyltransferase C-terminal domain-containing protein n=1 Tax=Asparagus officinalis TaxID=4686 RepID=A0A5P1EAG5_ASPOF|nr:uncharacterized protein A4U43_C09F5930 [Asparagus officinalis]
MFEFQHGKSMWDVARQNPEFNSLTNERMAADSRTVLHNWSDELDCANILKRCKDAIPTEGGKGDYS